MDGPERLDIDPETGEVTWTPDATQLGIQDVTLLVEDSQGGKVSQNYTIVVKETADNLYPVITSTPVFAATPGEEYQYPVTAYDPDGDAVTYQLLEKPDDTMTVDSNGVVKWTPTVEGEYSVTVGAVDSFGAGAAQQFTITVNFNDAPTITSNPKLEAVPGQTYRYDARAVDPDGDKVTFTLDDNAPSGMSVDEFGRISWKPDNSDVGTYPISLTATDTKGAAVTQSYDLTVQKDEIAPKVNLFVNKNPVEKGEQVTFVVSAADNFGVESLSLTVDGTPVALDAQGRTTLPINDDVEALASASDAAGNTGTASSTINAIDSSNTNAPIVELTPVDEVVSATIDINGKVLDDNLEFYTLSVAPIVGGEFVKIVESNATADGILGELDPSVLANGTYILRLEALDDDGNTSIVEEEVDIAGELKLGNFQLSFTDLSIPVSGIPISVTRTYDTLTANSKDNFGYGWRLEFRDTDLRTSLRKDEVFEELGVRTVAFKDKTRVYITLPGGKREAFTFKPSRDRLSGYMTSPDPEYDSALYHPEFVGDKGVKSKLTVQDVQLTHAGNEYYDLNGSPYNPADPMFGGKYTLTTKEGIAYEIDGTTGDLLTVTDTNGNKLTYSDAGIASNTGKSITFGRDAMGRITTVTDPMGKQIRYEYDEFGDLIAVTDRENSTTTFEYLAPNRPHFLTEINDPLGRPQVRTEYDDSGRLKRQLDVNGKDVEFIYDPNNSIQTVLDVFGKPTTYEYDERGNILQEIDAKAGITKRTYDEDNNLLSETDPDGVVTNYTYDGQGNMLTIEDGDKNITRMTYGEYSRLLSIVSPTGLSVSSKYDSRGNLIESTDTDRLITKFSYDNAGRLERQVSPDGQTMEWGYDSFGNPNRMVDSRGNEVKSVYDPNGWMKNASTQFTLNGQTYTLSTSFTYDNEGRTTSSTNSQGNSQSTVYNPLGQVVSTTDILGNVTSYGYDDKGLVTQITLPDNTPDNPNDNPKILKKYDEADRLTEETSTTGLVTKYVYDELGRLSETVLPDLTLNSWDDNPRVKTDYTPAGRLMVRTDIFGNQEVFDYNYLGRLIREKDILGNYTTYTYNKGGQLASITDPRRRTTQFVYDDKARLTETLFFDNSKTKVTYDALGRVETQTNELEQTTRYEYDPYSQVKAVINPLNERTEFEYNHRRNLVKVTDANNHATRYEYDQYGRQTATVYHTGDLMEMGYDLYNRLERVTDENRHTTQYFYNNLNQLTTVEQANKARTNYTYDNLGRLRKVEDANRNITEYEYDPFNRTVATVLPMKQRSQTVYDKFGQVKSYTDFNNDTINYAYDSYGRLDRKTFTNPNIAAVSYTYDPVTSQVLTVTDGRGETLYTYDNRDRLDSMTQPDGNIVRYGYDVLSNITSLTTNNGTIDYTYDALNRLDTVKEAGEILADYNYDKAGNLERTTLADGTVEIRGYDGRNRLTNQETKNTVGNIISSYTYTLDKVGNRKQVIENTGRTVDYTYDEVNRLTEEKITDAVAGNRTIGYGYDLVGNRKSRTDSLAGPTTYIYNANNQLTQTTSGSKVTQFTYDNNGSLKRRSDGTQTTTYDWINDGENRLVGVTSTLPGSTSNIKYIYDATGDRVASIADGVRTNYLVAPIWNLPQVLTEYNANGQVTADYTHGLDLIRSRASNNETFYHQDGLGSTRMLTDTTGLVTDRYNYDAFGVLLSPTSTSFNPYQFAGERRDSGTGLDYLRARYYDSSLGRFISKDAFSGFLDDPMSQHDYQYAHANPVMNTDPTGYFTLGDVSAAVTTASQLALIGSTSFSAGYITGGVLSGADSEEILQMFSDWGAGFASGVSGGYLTDVYEAHSGEKVEPKHGMLWGAGNIAGISTSFLLGMKLPTYAATTVGPLKWVAVAGVGLNTGFDVYGAATATQGLADGKWEWQDAWNLLAYVPFVGMIGGVKRGLGAAREVKKAASSMDVNIKSTSKALTEIGSEPPPPRPPACFVAGTEILTTEGEKDIEDILVGDLVIADDPTTPGEIEARQVLETFVRSTDDLVDLYVDGEVISTTNEHPFWVPDKGWVEAKDLQVGSLLQTDDGRIIDVDGIEKRSGQFEVYNFKVEDFHTYFVSDLGILVHNTCDPSGLRTWPEAGISPGDAKRIQNAANRTGQRIIVVGSRAAGTSNPTSDWDYILTGNSRQRHSAKSSLPRGTAGGEINSMGRETGMDRFTDPLDPNLPHVIFDPE